jgi:hypothetical protein
MNYEMSSYRPKGFAKTNTTTDEKIVQGTECLAYGCPLPASMSSSTVDGHKWYCRHHLGKKPQDNDAITYLIKKNYGMVWLADRLMNAPKYYQGSKEVTAFDLAFDDVKEKISHSSRPDLMPTKEKNRHGVVIDENDKRYLAWANRILRAFDDAVYKGAIHD